MERIEQSDTIENLVFSLKEDGAYSTTLVTYNTTAIQKENLLNGIFEIGTSININYTTIENDDLTNSILKLSFSDWLLLVLSDADDGCYTLDSDWGDWNNTVLSAVDCPTGDGSNIGEIIYSGGGIQISSGGGGGGDTSSAPTDPNYDPTDPDIHGNGSNVKPILTSPIDSPPQDTNLKKLRVLTKHPQIKAKISELRGKTNEDREYGYQFNITGNNPITYDLIEGELASDNQGIKFPAASVFTQLEMHMHYDGVDNAFSASDLYNMTKLSANSNNPEATAILVAPNGKLFALKVTDQTKADAFKILNEQQGEVIMKEYYYRYVTRWAQIKCNGCPTTEFENLINNYLVFYLTQIWDSGLTLYEATEDSDGNITWNAVTYTP